MKLLVIFFAALLTVQGKDLGRHHVYEYSDEDYAAELSPRLVLSHRPGKVGGLQRYVILTQYGQRSAPDFVLESPTTESSIVPVAPTAGSFVHQQRELPLATAATKGVSVETSAVANNVVVDGEEKVVHVVLAAPAGFSALEVPAVPEVPYI
ncbi:uncharacterized protein LOC105209989 [Zeugodacus cucurbitae]|uniref:Protein LTV1 homolog n=1 Tax=Zeugodacus cucurbitae TaxID=28588 RepID=A0A0A1WRG2_ZEUCU|nr:uncharacterized protein LOC105209989 [Zeugodacus cucurbitae]